MLATAAAAIDAGLTGHQFPITAPFLVGREKIREFADAIGAHSALHRDAAAARALGYHDVVAPPTFHTVLTMAVFKGALTEWNVAWRRVIHGEERYRFAQPIIAGDSVVVSTTVESVRAMAGNSLITFRADLATEAGEARVTSRSLFVIRAEEA